MRKLSAISSAERAVFEMRSSSITPSKNTVGEKMFLPISTSGEAGLFIVPEKDVVAFRTPFK